MAKVKREVDLVIAYKTCFGTEAGQIVLHDLMRTSHFFGSSFDTDALQMARKEGERNVILRICSITNTPMKVVAELMKEESDE